MSKTCQNIPDFEILSPDSQKYPVVFCSPHSGANYRDDFIAASRLKPLALRKSEDAFVDQLFIQMPALGCPLLKTNFPRAFLDVNRGPWELDAKMFSDPLPSYAETKTLRVIGGLGTIARNVSEKEKIYRKKLGFAEAKARIEQYYFPFHAALQNQLQETSRVFGKSLLIDCHSMPSNAVGTIKSFRKPPDIILGDRYGNSCDSELTGWLKELFIDAGFKTTCNKPYAGGYITETYGQPAQASHAIQIEINRDLYMNERTIKKSTDFTSLQNSLTEIMENFLPAASERLQAPALAAE